MYSSYQRQNGRRQHVSKDGTLVSNKLKILRDFQGHDYHKSVMVSYLIVIMMILTGVMGFLQDSRKIVHNQNLIDFFFI